ncbi:MAG: hypothetical protein HKO66_15300 [Saprospiraceae bacterium]|nr:hypothetical protein [Bacteroidia bacterium]NNL93607.1 hypothetical protein [Saprospiraceae bacterium]
MARIRTEYDSIEWDKNWGIYSLEEKDTYKIGFKLFGSTTRIGFIEFSIDLESGQFILMKTEFL